MDISRTGREEDDVVQPRDPTPVGPRPGSMLRAAGQVEARHQDIHRIQNDLAREVEQLRSGWRGPVAASFYQAYGQFDMQVERVKEGLDEIHARLVDTHRLVTEMEDRQRASVNRIAALINVPPTR